MLGTPDDWDFLMDVEGFYIFRSNLTEDLDEQYGDVLLFTFLQLKKFLFF